jgi:hypothetical protein
MPRFCYSIWASKETLSRLRAGRPLHDYCACFDKLSMKQSSSWHLLQENNFILSLSKDEAAAPAAVKTNYIDQAGSCDRFFHKLGAGEGQTWKDSPQPQRPFSFGLRKTKPDCSLSST